MVVSWLKIFHKYLGLVLFVISFYYVFINLGPSVGLVLDYLNDINFLKLLFLSIFLYITSVLGVGLIFYVFIKKFLLRFHLLKIQQIFLRSQIGKYIPGNIGHYLGRLYLSNLAGIPSNVSIQIIIAESFFLVLVAFVLSIFALLINQDLSWLWFHFGSYGLIFAFFFLILFFVMPIFAIDYLSSNCKNIVFKLTGGHGLLRPDWFSAIFVFMLNIYCFVVLGVILFLQSNFLLGHESYSLLEFILYSAVAWIAGYLLPGAPAGFGVREALIILLFSPKLGVDIATILGIFLRLTTILGDFASFLIGLIIKESKIKASISLE